ncbi:glycerophosphodiester phosphodiesterase family protein [Winogradskyella sp. DF17]|uniref:Glycerophosphodiester phosphodiesterase family protein n=1 Tax=Winogradskyella pelagia TaxID=2819984 RepID=A0ABS3SZT5_9FLAO|nr:glycerophosphodiester phosphodiesterase family protein [Winogradskyella sp. DF17]MBO3115994.1 glycerophosphodiester phosphodiesterase family protein [Winogradskyella sp. DF17]
MKWSFLKLLTTTAYVTVFLLLIGCKQSKHQESTKGFSYSNSDSIPFISVHRGGKNLFGYPENCLETMKYVNDSIPAIFEVDIAQTKDGKLVLMHDNSINRTTTGEGLIRKVTYDELSKLYLKDDYGNITKFKVPLFSEVLSWGKANNVILTADVKRSVSQKAVIEAIESADAENTCLLITYDLNQAKSAYRQAPELLLSVSARNSDEFQRLLNSRIPTENMVAFTGTRLSSAKHYKAIHSEDILCILGTLGNLDKQAKARGDELYSKWKDLGVDIIATDRPFEVFNALNKSN